MFYKGQVVSVDPDYYRVYVRLSTKCWEGPAVAAQVLMPVCDGLRSVQPLLPTVGSLVACCALDGDMRALVVMGSIPLNANDSINTVSGQTFTSSETHWSGFWRIMDEAGNLSVMFPDGTSLQIGQTANSPSGHRVNSAGLRVVAPFRQSQLVANTPEPFPVTLLHSTGTEVQISSAGAVLVSGVSTIQAIDGSGAYWELANNGNMNILANLNVSGTIQATEDITASTEGNNISVTNHIHDQGNDSHGDTEQSTTAPVANT